MNTITQLSDPGKDPLPIKSVLPDSADTFIAHYKAQADPGLIQSRLTQRHSTLISMAQVLQVKGSGRENQEQFARLQALLVPDAGLWLTTEPTHRKLTLTDRKWQWAAWLRLAMQVPADIQGCAGCGDKTAFINNAWHALSCIPLSSRAITDRHNEVLNRLADFCRLIYLSPHLEPAGLDKESEKRPDLQVALPDTTILADVTIIHPSCKTWRQVVSRKDIVAAGDEKEALKDKAYQPMAQALDMEFCACVFHTYGGFHSSALILIKKLTSAVDPATTLISPAEFKAALKRQIAIAIQRGNADIMIQASQRHREQALGKASYRHASRRETQSQTHHNTPMSAYTPAADTCEVNTIEEHSVRTHTTTQQTTVIVSTPTTAVLSTTETDTQGTMKSKEERLSSTASYKTAVDKLIKQLRQDMEREQTHKGERSQKDIEMEEIAEVGCMGAGDPLSPRDKGTFNGGGRSHMM